MIPQALMGVLALMEIANRLTSHGIQAKQGHEMLQMQRDWERNTGRKMKYPWNRDFSLKGMNQMMNGVTGFGGGLYQAHGTLTRWLRK